MIIEAGDGKFERREDDWGEFMSSSIPTPGNPARGPIDPAQLIVTVKRPSQEIFVVNIVGVFAQ
jgi:hypothetical protein